MERFHRDRWESTTARWAAPSAPPSDRVSLHGGARAPSRRCGRIVRRNQPPDFDSLSSGLRDDSRRVVPETGWGTPPPPGCARCWCSQISFLATPSSSPDKRDTSWAHRRADSAAPQRIRPPVQIRTHQFHVVLSALVLHLELPGPGLVSPLVAVGPRVVKLVDKYKEF
jgi:hypothetical protein